MPLNINFRHGVFETNSSSVHTVTLSNGEMMPFNRQMQAYFGDYGWGYEVLVAPEEKLSYIITTIAAKMEFNRCDDNNEQEEIKRAAFLKNKIWVPLSKAIEEYTGHPIFLDSRVERFVDSWNYYFGGIDHQSLNTLNRWLYPEPDIEGLMKIIFNGTSFITISNDNG